jgi:hypothetical protein
MNAAVESAELELIAEARHHKNGIEKMLAADRLLVTAVQAMEDCDSCIYDAIGDSKIASPATADHLTNFKTAGFNRSPTPPQ